MAAAQTKIELNETRYPIDWLKVQRVVLKNIAKAKALDSKALPKLKLWYFF
ncbi:hypothetical protein BGP_6611 [Beggiatoa sp. PS]|nr:hypothetical protein BGP_6611 [Beggiatoa sp. PS]